MLRTGPGSQGPTLLRRLRRTRRGGRTRSLGPQVYRRLWRVTPCNQHRDLQGKGYIVSIASANRTDPASVAAAMKEKARDTKDTAQAKMHQAQQHLHQGAETLQSKAGETTQQAKDLTDQVVAKLPPPVAGRLKQLMEALRQRPVIAAAVVLGALLVLWRLLRSNR